MLVYKDKMVKIGYFGFRKRWFGAVFGNLKYGKILNGVKEVRMAYSYPQYIVLFLVKNQENIQYMGFIYIT